MKLKNKKYLLFFLVVNIFLKADSYFTISSVNHNFILGYDSNPLRLSANEIYSDIKHLLNNTKYIHSRFYQHSVKINFYGYKNKKRTNYSLSFKNKKHFDNKKKSNFLLSFKIDQQLGKYRHFYFSYLLLPNLYLREYEDNDIHLVTVYPDTDFLDAAFISSKFTIEKLSIGYEHPINKRVSALKLGYLFEQQLFDRNFTEFDLKLKGEYVNFSYKKKNNRVSFYFEKLHADNISYLDGNISTSDDYRGYDQKRFKFNISTQFESKDKIGMSVDIYDRYYNSNIIEDKLHFMRKHIDSTISFWYKWKNHTIKIANRQRRTNSPESWVEDLKSFKRYIITYQYDLKTKL